MRKEGEHTAEEIDELAEAQEDLESALFEKEWKKAARAIKDYNEALKDSEEGSETYEKSCVQIADALSDLIGQNVTSQFVKEHQDLIDA